MINLLIALGCLFVYMCIVFGISIIRKDNGTADVAYGWGFVLVSLVTFVLGMNGPFAALVTVLATIWAARLSIRIYLRNKGKPEDFRYKAWRDEWGKSFAIRSFLQVYMLQGAVIYIVVLPVSLLNTFGVLSGIGSFGILLGFIGAAVWLIGFFFESVGDWQLAKFLRDPSSKGKVMDKGLWEFTRHPNYFGESTMWWGLALTSAGVLAHVWGVGAIAAFVGPALITFLLLKVSGVPLLEARMAGKPEWEVYKAKTSEFIPWFPKVSVKK